MANYYSDTAGSNTAPYDTWAKAATNPQTIVDTATAGDTCYFRGSYTQAATLDFDTNNGTAANPITYVGTNASGVEDGTFYTLDGNSAATNNININARTNLQFRNFKGINATGDGYASTGVPTGCHMDNMEFSSAGSDGFAAGNYYRCSISRIKANNNTAYGFNGTGVENQMSFCEAIGNGSVGIFCGNNALTYCVSHNNVTYGIWLNTGVPRVFGCVADGNTGVGFQLNGNASTLHLCRATNNTTYGVDNSGSFNVYLLMCSFFGNSTSATNGNVTHLDQATLTSDGYTDQANDDFSLSTTGEGVGIATKIGGQGATTTIYPTSGFPPAYPSASAPTFAGITSAVIYTNGVIKARWSAATGTTTGYRVYIRDDNSSIFTSTYLTLVAPSSDTSAFIVAEADDTMLRAGVTYHIGVRAVNNATEDSNTVTLNFQISPMGAQIKLPVVIANA